MSIIGLGIDIIENIRMENIYRKFKCKLAKRILSNCEWQQYQQCIHPVKYLIKRFVIKEAAIKALGIGIKNGITFNQFEVSNDLLGKPLLTLLDNAKKTAYSLGIQYIHVSLSHEKLYTCSVVIMEN